ncbi:hypothetical protein [Geodermatophilus sp. SYSU D00815]
MSPYDPEPWHDLGVAVAGACAALTGLLFVAVSLNLARILEFRTLPGRAARTLGLLVALLVAGVLLLVPGQPDGALAAELGGLGLFLAASAGTSVRHVRHGESPHSRVVPAAAVLLVPALALLVCGVSLAAGAGGGLYWLAAAVVTGMAGATVNAWVLLVEINR